jgi:suppressor for copper-sensitivity B
MRLNIQMKMTTRILFIILAAFAITVLPVWAAEQTAKETAQDTAEQTFGALPGTKSSENLPETQTALPESSPTSGESFELPKNLTEGLPSSLPSETGSNAMGGFSASPSAADSVVSVSARWTVDDSVKGGRVGQISVTARPKSDWYIYSITQKPGGPIPSKINLALSDAFKLTGPFVPDHPPKTKFEKAFEMDVETFAGEVTWRAPIELAEGVDRSKLKIAGKLFSQPCRDGACQAPQPFAFVASFDSSGKPTSLAAGSPPSPAEFSELKSDEGFAKGQFLDKISVEGDRLENFSFGLALLYGFLGGLILNVMPCVLPVIGLKILSFAQQAGKNRAHAFWLNVWYSAGLISVFLLLATLAVFAGFGWGQLFQLEWFNIAMAAVIFVLALSFLDVWEAPIPGFVGSGRASQMSESEGAGGAFAKGVLTTILATPCSAPFLGTALVWAMRQPPGIVYGIFIAMGLGMASPYLIVGAVPKLIRFIPKPGPWMELFKELMGFVLLATVVFIMISIRPGNMIATVALLFGLWGSCWWVGRIPPTAPRMARLRRCMEAIAWGVLVWMFAFGFLADDTMKLSECPEQFAEQKLMDNLTEGKPVLVDFTADWCLTCKTLEKTVLHSDPVQQAIKKAGAVFLVADWTDNDPEVTKMLTRLGSKQVPVIAIFSPANPTHPIVFRGSYTQQVLIEALDRVAKSK